MVALLRSLALIDDLTGLYNRRGLINLGHQHILLANRSKRSFILLYADFDNLKQINDRLGHKIGDQALKNTANLLKETFRISDVIARIGGDEFIILTIDAKKVGIKRILERADEKIQEFNNNNKDYHISLSWGYSFYDPLNPASLEKLLEQSDSIMYESKRQKKETFKPQGLNN